MRKSWIKSPQEIILIEKACRLGEKTFNHVLKKIKTGVTEKEISLEIQRFIRKNKATLSFRPIVAFGKNASEPHHKANNTILKRGDFIKLDLGAKLNGFCSDMTRTVFLGKATVEQKKMYEIVLEAQKRAIEFLNRKNYLSKKGLKASEVDKVARNYILSQGYPSIPHTLGHGIGKKVHECIRLGPQSKTILREGMVFSVEPGIYLKDFGGVRIEDLVVLTKTGVKILTHSTKEIVEL